MGNILDKEQYAPNFFNTSRKEEQKEWVANIVYQSVNEEGFIEDKITYIPLKSVFLNLTNQSGYFELTHRLIVQEYSIREGDSFELILHNQLRNTKHHVGPVSINQITLKVETDSTYRYYFVPSKTSQPWVWNGTTKEFFEDFSPRDLGHYKTDPHFVDAVRE